MNSIKYEKIIDISKNIVTGKTPSTKDEENFSYEYPFITPSDIPSYYEKYITKTERGISTKGSQSLKGYMLPKDSICVVCIGSTIGKMCYTTTNCFTNQQINSVVPKDEYNPNYLFYLIRYIKGYFQLIGGGTGSGKGIVNKTTFGKIKLPILDDRKAQDKIASILSTYDDLIEKNNRKIEILQEMAEELYKEWFVRRKSSTWATLKLKQFGYEIESGARPKGGIDDSLIEGIPSLGAEVIDKLGVFDYSNKKLIPNEFYEKMKRGTGKDKDILLYKDGAYIGKVTLFMDKFPYEKYAVNEHVFLMRAKNDIYQYFLYFTLNQPQYFTTMQNLNRNAAQPGLTGKDLDIIKICKPDEHTITKFNSTVEPMLHNIFSFAKQNNILKQQRDLLLPRLMSGKLEVKGDAHA